MKRFAHWLSLLRSQPWQAVPIALSIILLGLAGCGADPRGTVSGTVTYKDKPLPGGTVVFVAENLKQERVPINADGTYSSSNIPLGEKVKVGVEPAPKGAKNMMPKGQKPPTMPEGGPKDVYGGGASDGKEYRDIPQVLRDPATSKIVTKVERGEQKFDIPLKDPN